MSTLRLALAQINPLVGDIRGNTRKIVAFMVQARARGADLVAFPELAVTGYPPEDLILRPSFIEEGLRAMDAICHASGGMASIVGFVDRADGLYNAAAIISAGRIVDVYHKRHLPNYGVFDEHRYFLPGRALAVHELGGVTLGVGICEDIWSPEGPALAQAGAGASLIVNINASPYSMGKQEARLRMLRTRAADCQAVIAYINMVGGQDELVFDGRSLIVGARGDVLAQGGAFEEQLIVSDLELDRRPRRGPEAAPRQEIGRVALDMPPYAIKPPIEPCEAPAPMPIEQEVYGALALGLRDYVRKNRFKGVLVGLSGGVDSAFVATLASDALGAQGVTCVYMPSEYSSDHSREDARRMAGALGARYEEIPIGPAFDALRRMLAPALGEADAAPPGDTTYENLQARVRGTLLMAISNRRGLLVLTTGNKSEMSVGYATLYGDMAGGFAVIKDLPKTLLYRVAEWRNARGDGPVIPRRILEKAPSAELRPGQFDTDSLPPYDELDPVLEAYVERDEPAGLIAETAGCGPETALRVMRMVDRSEYKRRQAPPGIKITARAFGRDRRLPITNGYEPGGQGSTEA